MTPSHPEPSSEVSTFRLRRRTPGTFVLIPCPRIDRSLRCQGQLEAAAATILAACPTLITIQEQPLQIWYAWRETPAGLEIQLLSEPPTPQFRRKQNCSYIVPDFLVEMQSSRKRLVEVKPSSKLTRPTVQRKLAVGREYATKHGWTFHVVTEREAFAGPLLDNLRLMGRFRHLVVDPHFLTAVEHEVRQRPTILSELFALQTTLADAPQTRAAVLHLAVLGRLDFDPRLALFSDQLLLFPGGTILWDPFDSLWAPSGSWTNVPTASSANSRPINSS